MSIQPDTSRAMEVRVRAMAEADLAEAWRVHRLAFGTHFGLPDPMAFRGDADLVRARFGTNPEGAVVAEADDGRIAGGGFVMDWGSVAVLGPLFVDPALWSQGIARRLMAGLVERIDARGHAFAGLFTFPDSPAHVRLYEAFGFEAQRMVAVMERPTPGDTDWPAGASLLSETRDAEAVAAACRAISDSVYPGLDLSREIAAIAELGYGDVVLINGRAEGTLAGFALCHHGPGSEGGGDQLFVKFGAVRPGADAAADCRRLLEACEALAGRRGAAKVQVGTNAGRAGTYRMLRERGYRSFLNGIAMLRPPGEGYGVPEAYAFDDWR